MKDDSQFDPWMFAAGCVAVVALCAGIESYNPTSEERYQQRVDAHFNLPRWARGDCPRRNEPRQSGGFFLDW